jgi:effector-binding domain-containing protein
MSTEISIVNVKPQLVLGMRKTGPYKSIGVMIPQICQFAAQNGIQMIGPPCTSATKQVLKKPYKLTKKATPMWKWLFR